MVFEGQAQSLAHTSHELMMITRLTVWSSVSSCTLGRAQEPNNDTPAEPLCVWMRASHQVPRIRRPRCSLLPQVSTTATDEHVILPHIL